MSTYLTISMHIYLLLQMVSVTLHYDGGYFSAATASATAAAATVLTVIVVPLLSPEQYIMWNILGKSHIINIG